MASEETMMDMEQDWDREEDNIIECFHEVSEQKGFGYVCLKCSNYSQPYHEKIEELNRCLDFQVKHFKEFEDFVIDRSENGLWLDEVEEWIRGI